MSHDPTWLETFAAVWPTLCPDVQEASANDTIRPSLTDSDGAPLAAVAGLLPAATQRPAVRDLGAVLGEGGMGVVREAVQVSLQRPVAAKALRSDVPRAAEIRRLLQEAWVTGILEHPAIVPVYDIAADSQGRPIILMKHVAGRHWGQLCTDAEAVHDSFGVRDLLDWNLRTFLTVCQAVHYAHEHGVLHRDIKPDNVMIGRFGEVCVLDWGMAVAIDDRHGGKLPLAANENRLAGTPRLMAPEMVLARGELLTVRTDVYLLGATLYAVLTGSAPHRGPDLEAIFEGIGSFVPTLPDQVPQPIAEVVRRAMAIEPEHRFPTVDAMRQAVQEFLERRSSLALSAQATVRAGELERAVRSEPERVPSIYGEAVFAFREALREWPDNEAAHGGLQEVHLLRVEHALAQGHTVTARTVLAELDAPPPELLARTEALEQAQEAEWRELAARRRDDDPSVGVRTRMFVLGIVMALWIVMPLVGTPIALSGTWAGQIASSGLLLAVAGGLGLWGRDSLSKTSINRRTYLTLLLIPVLQLVLDGAAFLLGLHVDHAFVLRLVLWTAIAAMYSVGVEWRVAPTAMAFAVGALIAARWPELRAWVVSGSSLVLAVNVALLWGQRLREASRQWRRERAANEALRTPDLATPPRPS